MNLTMLDEKLIGELLVNARKELRVAAITVDQCREEWAVTYARKEAIIMSNWKQYLDTFDIALTVAMEPCFQSMVL
jgi:hypothetical protein